MRARKGWQLNSASERDAISARSQQNFRPGCLREDLNHASLSRFTRPCRFLRGGAASPLAALCRTFLRLAG
jgi:hypothetical protein